MAQPASASATSTSTPATASTMLETGARRSPTPSRSSTSASCSTASARSSPPSTRRRSTSSSTRSPRPSTATRTGSATPSTTWPRCRRASPAATTPISRLHREPQHGRRHDHRPATSRSARCSTTSSLLAGDVQRQHRRPSTRPWSSSAASPTDFGHLLDDQPRRDRPHHRQPRRHRRRHGRAPELELLDATALGGLDEMARASSLAGRNGEWLNQTILVRGHRPAAARASRARRRSSPASTPLGVAGPAPVAGATSVDDGVDVDHRARSGSADGAVA